MATKKKKGTKAGKAAVDPALSIDPGRVTRILTSFLAQETRRAGRSRLVVGLSGGLDSSVVAVLASRALGTERVLGVLMPYRTSSPESVRHARMLVRKLGIDSREVDITPMIEAYFGPKARASKNRQGNKMARERMSVLYDLSEATRALVAGTSNKTEMLLGYGTLHGDLACALNPLGDLYKTQVRQLAAHLKIPRPIRDKPPSADLWPGQTDEGELGISYEEADRLLHRMVDRRGTEKELVEAGFERRTVRRIREQVRCSQFKRRLPLIAKVSLRTVGIDFRYPRDWGT
jgi:NAD+ synthase